jgi:hypothetical protein
LASIIGSIWAFDCRSLVVVVVLVVGAVVVQPTIATIQTPKTSGISFFMMLVLPERSSNHNPLPHASLAYGRNSEALMSRSDVVPHNSIAPVPP